MTSTPIEFTLTITPEARPGRYRVAWDAGAYEIDFRPETDVSLGDLLRRLPAALVGLPDSAGQFTPVELVDAVGAALWHALLPVDGPVAAVTALRQVLRTGTAPLLLALPPALAVLPWEVLRDPEQPDERGVTALRRPVVRLIPGGAALPMITEPLRVLLLISSPPGLAEHRRVDVESERSAVEEAVRPFREAGHMHLLVEDIVTRTRVQQALIRFKPHILHYIGHGGYQDGVGGYLEWEDDQGQPLLQSDARIAGLLRSRGLRAVILHGCETAVADRRTDLSGVAGALLGAGIPAVIAQQAKLTYESSQRASELFYTAITSGLSLAEASFELRLALSQEDRPDWAAPILQATRAGLAPLLDQSLVGVPDPVLALPAHMLDLPAPTGVFVGRQAELRQLRAMLEQPPGRGPTLALITGPGGIGKSTLVAQAAMRYGLTYKAVITLSLAGYQGMDLLLQQLGQALQRQGAPGLLNHILPDPQRTLEAKSQAAVDELGQAGPLLVIVDNVESAQNQEARTLVDPALRRWLQQALVGLRRGRVLVTGRYAVEGLLPEGKFAASLLQLDLDDLSRAETRQLLQRHPTLAQLDAVIMDELVAEFGGLPYVYDLLSSQASRQSLAALVHDIQGRITAERKQRAREEWALVRRRVVEFAALEATMKRLPTPSRTLLDQLAVPRRPFPLELVEQGLGAERAVWQPLLDHALLRYNPATQTYRLHSLTQQYVADLANGAVVTATQRQVAAWYQGYVDRSHDLADILEAHELWLASGDAERAGEVANGLADTLSRFGLYEIWRDLAETTRRTAPEGLAAEAIRQLGMIKYAQGDYDEAHQFYIESLSRFKQLNDQRKYATALISLGTITQAQGRYDEARQIYAECLHSFEQVGDQFWRAKTLHQLGMIAQVQGNYDEARQIYAECLHSFEQVGDHHSQAKTLLNLGMIAQVQGNYDEARQIYTECLHNFEQVGDYRGQARILHCLGNIALDQGRYDEARQRYAECMYITEQLGDQVGRFSALHQLGNIAYVQGRYDESHQYYDKSLAITEHLGDQRGRAMTLQQLGNIATDQGRYDEARTIYAENLTNFERLGDQGGRAATLHQLGNIALAQGRYDEASERYAESLTSFERLGDQGGRATTLHQLGNIAYFQGCYDEARTIYAECLDSFERLGDQRGRATTLHQLGKIAQNQGRYDEARTIYAESLDITERLGDQRGRATTLHQLGNFAFAQGRYDEARQRYAESLHGFEQVGDQRGRAGALANLGMIAQGHYDEAFQYYTESLAITKRLGNQGELATTLGKLGMLAHTHCDYRAAIHYTAQALQIFEHLGSPSHEIARRSLEEIQAELGAKAFVQIWNEVANGVILPELARPNLGKALHRRIKALYRRIVASILAWVWKEE